MREIKFRGWDKLGERMLRTENVTANSVSVEANWNYTGFSGNDEDYEIMQYTNLKDKNGVEIYEGDILRYWDTSGKETDKTVVVTITPHGVAGVNNTYPDKISIGNASVCYEIIGTIYENPELIPTHE